MKKVAKKKLVLLDAHAIIHRAYHALPDFSSSKGEPTGALFGLSTMLMKIIQELQPDYIAACFDLPKPTFRHDVYADYKGGRAKTDDALVEQIKKSRAVFAAFNIPLYEAEGFEADDCLGTITEQLKSKPIDIVIASGDMDTLQLVEESRVFVYTLKKGIQDTILYDEKAVVARFGFGPEMLIDYKGLRGDPSDNIPGIKGIGEKTATVLITSFGTIENIYTVLEKNPESFINKGITKRMIGLLKEGKDEAFFSKMLATIRRDAPIMYKVPKSVWKDEVDAEAILTLFTQLEFRTLYQRARSLLGIANASDVTVKKEVQENIEPFDLAKVQIAVWLLKSDITNPTKDDVLRFIPGETFKNIYKVLIKEMKKQGLYNLFNTIEMPLIPVIKNMDKNGIALDTQYLEKLSKEYHKALSKIERKIYKIAGTEFNINSPKQLGEVLFDTLGLKPKNQKKTATGQRSTKESELEKLKNEHVIISDILSYRELQKLLSTYIDALPALVGKDERLHAEFLQAGTTTGRMASQNPNLQNIPIKTEYGQRIRNAFIAQKGYVLVSLDYSQIELRIAAILSKDKKLLDVFRSGGDIHTAVASEVFGVTADKVDKEMRRRAKVINFGILYGMGVNALRANLGGDTTQADARVFYDTYFTQYKELAKWIDITKADASRLGYTKTMFGRRRYFEGMKSSLPHIRAAAERMAINAPVQGTSADIIKKAMVNIYEYIETNKLTGNVKLVSQVHDELIYEIKEGMEKNVIPEIKKRMEGVLTSEQSKGVPLLVDVSVGKNWGEMK